jgi:hypothetical protein
LYYGGYGKQRRAKTRKEEAEAKETEDYSVVFGSSFSRQRDVR